MNPAEAYILNQEEPFRSILLELQAFIEHHLPQADLKYKYRLPFYYLKGKPFCYLNTTREYVDLGLCHGAHLTVHLDQLESKGRKLMKSLRYATLESIDHAVLKEVLQEAARHAGKSIFRR